MLGARFVWMVVVLGGMASPALAGDPCPIPFDVYDAGSPGWFDRDELLSELTSQSPWAGIQFADTNAGVQLRQVYADSPAAAAGLQRGDLVLAVDGADIKSERGLADALDARAVGASMVVVVHRGNAERLELTMVLGRRDPLVASLTRHAAQQACTSVNVANTQRDLTEAFHGAAFDAKRRLRCKNAHRFMMRLDDQPPGRLVIVRGRRRVLLSLIGAETVCVAARHYDGDKLTERRIGRLFKRVSERYVTRRHRNP